MQITNSSLTNSKLIDVFLKELSIRGLSERRMKKYIILLKKLHFKLIKLNKRHVDKFFFYLRDAKLSDETKADYWSMFRIFVKWLKPKIDTREYRLKLRFKTKLPEEILTLDEIRKIILSAASIRNRSLISLLYDSGCRPALHNNPALHKNLQSNKLVRDYIIKYRDLSIQILLKNNS